MSEQEKDPKNAEPQVETAEEQQAAQAEAANAEAEAPAPEQPSAEEQLAEVEAELAKVKKALASGLQVILCVGELQSEREADQTEAVLDTQMTGGLDGVDASAFDQIVIAYEPVWAIGTGLTATPDQAEAAHQYLRNWLKDKYSAEIADATRILYGGSVKPDNAQELLSQENVDGALVGGASLKPELFIPIIQAAAGLAAS
jgi:triosephosphate isomerase